MRWFSECRWRLVAEEGSVVVFYGSPTGPSLIRAGGWKVVLQGVLAALGAASDVNGDGLRFAGWRARLAPHREEGAVFLLLARLRQPAPAWGRQEVRRNAHGPVRCVAGDVNGDGLLICWQARTFSSPEPGEALFVYLGKADAPRTNRPGL